MWLTEDTCGFGVEGGGGQELWRPKGGFLADGTPQPSLNGEGSTATATGTAGVRWGRGGRRWRWQWWWWWW